MSLARLGKSHEEIYGVEAAKKRRLKMSTLMIGKNAGERHGGFRGWKSREPYGVSFSPDLKLKIRERDNFSCQLCPAVENRRSFIPHHIDYNKTNNKETNLILLCQKCNSIVNFEREKWQFLFEVLTEIGFQNTLIINEVK